MRVVRIGESSKRERAATPRPFRHAPFWGCDAYIGPLTEQRWDKREGARLVLKFGERDNSSLPPEEEREVRKGANGISSANNSSMNGCGPTGERHTHFLENLIRRGLMSERVQAELEAAWKLLGRPSAKQVSE